jgi:hypothetical protein
LKGLPGAAFGLPFVAFFGAGFSANFGAGETSSIESLMISAADFGAAAGFGASMAGFSIADGPRTASKFSRGAQPVIWRTGSMSPYYRCAVLS